MVHVRWVSFLVYYIFKPRSDVGKCMLYKMSALVVGLKEGWERVKLESGRPMSRQKPCALFSDAFIHV